MKSPAKIGRTLAASLLLTACWLLASPAVAEARGNASVAASLSDASVDAGDQTQFRISVTNGEADAPPHAPIVDGLNISYAGRSSSSQYTFNNGALSQSATTTYVYSVDTERPGRYIIPGQEVKMADGTSLRTLPVALTVLGAGGNGAAGGNNAPAYVELVVPKKTAYLGESIPVEIRAGYIVNSRHNADPEPILSGDGFSVGKFTAPRAVGQLSPDGRYNVDLYKSAIAGVKIGALSVGPVTIMPTVQLPRGSGSRRRSFNDPFDSLFGGQFDPYNMGMPRQVRLQSQPVALEIKPLPEAGKPANFSGAIGQFRLEAEAVPNKAATGDPVTVRLRLSGQGNFDRAAAPILSDDRGLRTYPPSEKFKADDEVGLSGTKTFEQVVIAEGPRTSLPSYRFNYLDPATGKYVVVDTQSLPVKIEGRNLATPTPAPAFAANPSPTPPPVATPARASEDILYIRADQGDLQGAGAFRPLYRRTGFWVTQAGIMAAVLALAGVSLLRTRRADGARQRAAQAARQSGDLQRALRREDAGRRDFYTAATRLAQLRAGGAGLSAAEIVRVRGLDPQAAGSVQAIFDRHAELVYSGGPAAETPVSSDERRDVLATLDALSRN